MREVHQRGLEIDEGDALVHGEALDLAEHRRVRRVEGVVPIDHSGDHNAVRRRRVEHGPDLHRRGVRAHEQAARPFAADGRGVDIERVVHIHRRVVGAES